MAISAIHQFSIYHATKDVKFGSKNIAKNDFFALANNKILGISDTLESITLSAIDNVLKEEEYEVITLFYGKDISPEYIDGLIEKLYELGYDSEFAAVPTFETIYDITVTFE